MGFLFFMFGLFSCFISFDILRVFVYKDIHSFCLLRFFDWLKKDRYLEKKLKDTSYSIDLIFDKM